MAKRKLVNLILIPWTGVGLHGGFRGNAWYEARIKVFKDHTLKSLANQTNKNFTIWCTFRPEEEFNPRTWEVADTIEESGLNYLFTFDGLPYWDDKFTTFNIRTVARNCLMMLMDCWRNKEYRSPLEIIRNCFENKNKTLLKRVGKTLKTLQTHLPESTWIYVTRLDSDDMFHKGAIELVQSVPPRGNRALLFDKGYVLNKQTGQLAEWNPTTNPPFYTIIFQASEFFSPKRYLLHYGSFRSHESITTEFDCLKLPNKKYCYVVNHRNISTYWNTNKMYLVTTGHNTNIGTRWNTNKIRNWWIKHKNPNINIKQGIHPFIGKEFHGIIKKKILKDFGI